MNELKVILTGITMFVFIMSSYLTLQIIIIEGIKTSNMYTLERLSITNIITTVILIVLLIWNFI